jgi:hypothetical protein
LGRSWNGRGRRTTQLRIVGSSVDGSHVPNPLLACVTALAFAGDDDRSKFHGPGADTALAESERWVCLVV